MGAKRAIAIAAVSLIGVGSVAYGMNQWSSAATPALDRLAVEQWSAVAPALIEPIDGVVRVSAPMVGRLTRLHVHQGQFVEKGQLLAELDNTEQLARLRATVVDVAFRKSERDNAILAPEGSRRRAAEDAAYDAWLEEDALRDSVDELYRERSIDALDMSAVEGARSALVAAIAARRSAEQAAGKLLRAAAPPQPTRTESALALARTDHAIARAAFEKTLIRAPAAGTIVELFKHAGETAENSASDSAFIIGDLRHMHLRAELNERMITRVRVGQEVVVRSEAFDREFTGRVTSIGSSVHPKRLSTRAPGEVPTQRVVDVLLSVNGEMPPISGISVDVYFKKP